MSLDDERLSERFREKLRDRNLGRVSVRTYPAKGPGAIEVFDLDARVKELMAETAPEAPDAAAVDSEKPKAKKGRGSDKG